jgi:tripartite-type tricarboxylate transporter receptor subunit TctC
VPRSLSVLTPCPKCYLRFAFGIFGALLLVTTSVSATAQYFRGKTINMYIGFSVGGGYDIYGRLLARHIGKHIRGNPNIVPVNMPGGGGMKLSLFLRDVAPKDGTAFGIVDRGLLVSSFVNPQMASLDFSQLNWVGSITGENLLCVSWHTSAVKNTEDLLTKTFVAGGISRSDISYTSVSLLNKLFGAQIKFIPGYPGSNDLVLAMERGELQGRCAWSQTSLLTTRPTWLNEKKINVLLQYGTKRDPAFADVPTALEIARSEADRAVIRFLFAPEEIARPIVAPPGLPPEQLRILRSAFDASMTDKALLEEAQKASLEVNPRTGDEVTSIIKELYKTPPSVVAKAAEILK